MNISFLFRVPLQHADVNVKKILIGNKCDMTDQRVVTTGEGEALAKEYQIPFYETSAKQDTNVETSFLTIATQIKDRILSEGGGGSGTGGQKITAAKPEAKPSGGGCC